MCQCSSNGAKESTVYDLKCSQILGMNSVYVRNREKALRLGIYLFIYFFKDRLEDLVTLRKQFSIDKK